MIPKVIIADDHDMFKDAIQTMLEIDGIAEVIATASNGKEVLELLNGCEPEIILMDIDMPIMDGIEASKQISERFPHVKIMALSMFGEEKYYKEMIEAGAKGFVLKSSGKKELERAIKEIAMGESYFSNELLRKIISKIGKYDAKESTNTSTVDFTNREKEVIQNLCLGLSTQEIAEKLFLSTKTVENYRVKLLNKTNCKNSVGLVVYAIKNGIVEI